MDGYQQQAARTLPPARDDVAAERQLSILGLGLAGESGEVVEILKKVIGHGHTMDKKLLKKELGDVLWYLTSIATCTGIDLEDVANANIEKLLKRYPSGFTQKDSQNRKDP